MHLQPITVYTGIRLGKPLIDTATTDYYSDTCYDYLHENKNAFHDMIQAYMSVLQF